MTDSPSLLAIVIFLAIVGFTLGLSFFLGRQAKDSSGYFAAHGQIPWFVNGVAFAGDYLSAASFLGICGMIAFYGYDGFLYSIGYLAGWIVALFVIAEPLKRMGRFTFADALNSRFQSKGIQLAAGVSTLTISVFYLIPQMVGAGVLVKPLLGLPIWLGVVLVGTIVILIVVTAGMVSTTWVQFIKGSLLVLFSGLLTVLILQRGLEVKRGGVDGYQFTSIELGAIETGDVQAITHELIRQGYDPVIDSVTGHWAERGFWRLVPEQPGPAQICRLVQSGSGLRLLECQTRGADGADGGSDTADSELHPTGFISRLQDNPLRTGPIGPIRYLQPLTDSEVVLWSKTSLPGCRRFNDAGLLSQTDRRSADHAAGRAPDVCRNSSAGLVAKLNFLSLMLACSVAPPRCRIS